MALTFTELEGASPAGRDTSWTSATFECSAGDLLLIAVSAGDNTESHVFTASDNSESGSWTSLSGHQSANFDAEWFYKVANGSEKTVTVGLENDTIFDVLVAKVTGWTGTPTLEDSDEDETYVASTASSSVGGGSLTNTTANGIAIMFVVADGSGTIDGSRSVSDGSAYTEGAESGTQIWLYYRTISSTGTYSPVYSFSDTGDEAYGASAVFGDVAAGTTVSVPSGSLTLTGYAPTVATTANQTIAVPSGTLTLTGNNPTVVASDHKTIAIPVGTLTLTGLDPTVTVSGAGSVTVQVPSGTLTLGGHNPTVIATGNITVSIPAGSLSLTGFAPTVLTPRLVEVPSGTLTLTGNNPTVITTANQVLSIPSGTLTLTGFAPTVIGEVVSNNKGGISDWTESDYKLRQRLRKQALAQAALQDDEEALTILLASLLRR